MKGYSIDNNPAVIRMAGVNVAGNVIPMEWFKHVKRENGKPHSIAIMLLADIVYWYRPIEERDEKTGRVTGYKKKFAADLLQRDYTALADAYGYTKNQVRDALDCLENLGVIKRDWRAPVINGRKFGNVLYIGLNVDRLIEITHPTLSGLNSTGSPEIIGQAIDFKADTNTEITTEISSEDIGGDSPPNEPPALAPDPSALPKSVKNPRTFQALEKFENREDTLDLSWLAESLRPLAAAFVKAAGEEHRPQKWEQSKWRKILGQQRSIGLTADDILQAVKKMRTDGLTIKGPESVTGTARDLKSTNGSGQLKSEPAVRWSVPS
jgi:hypothetical protein